MHGGDAVGLDDHRRTHRAFGQLGIEGRKGAGVAGLGQQIALIAAADAQQVGMAAVPVLGDMAQLGKRAAGKPAQQLRTFRIVDQHGIGGHRRHHLRPVGHGHAHVGQRRFQQALEFATLTGIDARGLDIDHRFAQRACDTIFSAVFRQGDKAPLAVTLDGDDRVRQTVDHQASLGNRGGNRIDQERHVVVDQRDAQIAALLAGGDHFDHRGTGAALRGGIQQHARGLVDPGVVLCRSIAGQQGIADARDDRRVKCGPSGPFVRTGLCCDLHVICAHNNSRIPYGLRRLRSMGRAAPAFDI